MKCETCVYWTDTDEWEAKAAGMKLCEGIKERWVIEDECTALLEKYPDNEPTVEVNWDDVGERWLEAHRRGFEKEKAFVQDASQYKAELYTRPEFFCAKYKEKEQ